MSDRLSGRVLSVESAPQGAVAVSWTATSLLVWDASDFVREGGQFTVDGSATVYDYVSVTEGESDDDPDVVTTVQSSPGGFAGEFPVSIYPAAVDVVAQVELPQTADAIPAVVPHALRPLLADGVRDLADCEAVELIPVGASWQVADVVGREARIGAVALSSDVWDQVSASGSHIWHRDHAPDVDGVAEGDLWFEHDPVTSATVHMYQWQSGAWVVSAIGGTVLTDVDAGSITTGVMQGIDIYSPNNGTAPGDYPKTHMGGGLMEVVRLDDQGAPYRALAFGGPDPDQISIRDNLGNSLAALNSDGSITGAIVNADAATIGGYDVGAELAEIPRNLVDGARQSLGSTSALNNVRIGSSECGTVEMPLVAQQGHVYRIGYAGHVNVVTTAASLEWRVRATTAADGATPTAPLVSSTQYGQRNFQNQPVGNNGTDWSFLWTAPDSNNYRFLWTLRCTGSNYALVSAGDTWRSEFYIEDLGLYNRQGDGRASLGGGTPYSGSTGTTPESNTATPQQITGSFAVPSSHMKSWRAGTEVTDYLQQGNYGGAQRYSTICFPSAMRNQLSGATIQSITVTLNSASWWYGAGGKYRIGRFLGTAYTPTLQTSGGTPVDTGTVGTGQHTFTLNSGMYAGIAAGTVTGITLGEGAGATLAYYGKSVRSATFSIKATR
ncbi:hypothetical protein ACSDQ9_05745 [Aestuariimicrobium soli]|uniref:hypothetical protein n=1 Tax=Aestuariimicrobium soli TaxID=2035834 RepID=UPI003EB716A0